MQVVIFSSPGREEMLANTVREFSGYDVAIIADESTFGIDKFWQRWEQARRLCLNSPHDNYLIISDDASEHDIEAIEAIHHGKNMGGSQAPFVCAVISDERKTCWGSRANNKRTYTMGGYIVEHCDYFDCGGLTNRATLEQFEVTKTNRGKRASSGLGLQLTTKFRELGIPMYKTSPSLSYHGEHPSVMHPEVRKLQPLIANVKQPRVVVGIATFKGREKTLKRTVESLEGQVDEIVIYDNEQNPNLTDNGKFWYLSQMTEPCIFLSCDDDIIYPHTYRDDMVKAIKKHKCIVTHHGRKLKALGVPYYGGHESFHCIKANKTEKQIDVAGTGVTGWHTSYFHPKDLHSAKDQRMSDLVFSLAARKAGKKIVVLEHKQGYIGVQNIPISQTIYGMEHKKAHRQVELADEILKLGR
ncbi:MAG: hypothetical protein GQ553_00985 [Nitrosomonadaceae bacterium]|nr:hypothetical protein [Nitrosomonadaceae bacterium]